MGTRLVLGCGSLGHTIVETLVDRKNETLVVTDDDSRVETLREENIPAVRGDPTDPAAVAEALDGRTVTTIVVAGSDPERNRLATVLAAEHYPAVLLVAYTGEEPTVAVRSAITERADRVIDTGQMVASRSLSAAGRGGRRVRTLQRLLRTLDGPLAVVMHDNPDPDAIASAMALCSLAQRVGKDATAFYGGDIAHQENRALVNLLEYDLTRLDDSVDLDAYGGVALVDHSRPGVNDALAPETAVDIVIDHHPPREPVEARFVDLRSDVGATSTLLVDYLQRLNIAPSQAVATGLLYGIRVDTKEFSREVSIDDYQAASFLLEYADTVTLERVESPSVSADTLVTIGRAIDHRVVEGDVLTSYVGDISDRDALAQAADRLLDLENVTTTFVYGVRNETIFGSARARGTELDVGETLRDAFSQIGAAGGHADMAGTQIPLGGIQNEIDLAVEAADDDAEATEARARIIEEFVTERFYEELRARPSWNVHRGYGVENLHTDEPTE